MNKPIAETIMEKRFVCADQKTAVRDIIEKLNKAPGYPCIIVDRSHRPINMAKLDDLERVVRACGSDGNLILEDLQKLLPPAFVIESCVELISLLHPRYLGLISVAGGIIVVKDACTAGVIPLYAFDDYVVRVQAGKAAVTRSIPGNKCADLSGDINWPPGRITCSRCGSINELYEFNIRDPPDCVNSSHIEKHKIATGWV